MKINIEDILTENEIINSNGNTSACALGTDRKAQKEEYQDEIMKLRIALEEKGKQYLSILADFDNLKKRVDRDSRLRVQKEKGELINRVLEVIDNLKRAICSVKNYRHDPFFDGILSTYRQLISVLREYRVERIACLGKGFDPNIHEAVGAIKTGNFDRNTVIDEAQKGYVMDDKLLCASKVHVAV